MKNRSDVITVLIFSLITLSSVVACANKNKAQAGTKDLILPASSTDSFIYNYGDASTSPLYHRSYMIRVIPQKIYFSIDVYGEIRGRDSLVLSRASYDSFATSINNLHIKYEEESKTEGCTGGTTDALELYAGTSRAVKGHIYYCGGQQFGNLAGDVASAAGLFKALIPDLQQRIDATRKNN